MEQAHGWAIATASVSLLLALVLAQLGLSRLRRRFVARRRARRASAGEREAEGLLRAEGFTIEARQVESTLCYRLSGAPVEVTVRADLIVRRAGRRYVAEVKTGTHAPRLSHAPTRRQLLEYAHAFAVDGVLLVDADRRAVDEVSLPTRPTPRRSHTPALLGALALACGLVWLLSAQP